MDWKWSALVYLLIVAAFEWSFFRWESARDWSWEKRHLLNVCALVILVALSALGVRSQYQRENSHDPKNMPVSEYDLSQTNELLQAIEGKVAGANTVPQQLEHFPGLAAHISPNPDCDRAAMVGQWMALPKGEIGR